MLRGGRLDYAILFNMNEVRASIDILYELVSDHFTLKVTLGLDKVCGPTARTRYKLKDGQHRELMSKVKDWYKCYKNTVHDVIEFYEDMLQVIDSILSKVKSQEGGISQLISLISKFKDGTHCFGKHTAVGVKIRVIYRVD